MGKGEDALTQTHVAHFIATEHDSLFTRSTSRKSVLLYYLVDGLLGRVQRARGDAVGLNLRADGLARRVGYVDLNEIERRGGKSRQACARGRMCS